MLASLKNKKPDTSPWVLLGFPSSAEDQLQCAKLWIAEKSPASAQPLWRGEIYKNERINVGYVSGDFNQHVMSLLTVGMYECHDRSRFKVTALSYGPDDGSALRRRLQDAFEQFIDVAALHDAAVAARIRDEKIDILVDLKGLTQNARPGIFAQRPAPVQVNYLGYAGTMGADYMDYVVGDRTLIPHAQQACYSENIVHLPNSFFPNDAKRVISDRVFTRAELGLPERGFVFCCFNNNYKILPDVFDGWMRILARVEGSVLWLLQDSPIAMANLRREAAARGIDGGRLVFAPRMALPDHLARHRSADLFIDTLPYNAHATAGDALWAGLPVLTRIGEAFAGRVAASMLNAIGLPELATRTPDEYEALAVELAAHPARLAAIKDKLARNRLTTALFNTELFTRHMESAYTAMYERYRAGLPPAPFDVAAR